MLDESIRKGIGFRLKLCRMEKNMKQEEVAEKIDIGVKSYSNIETGTKLFSIEVFLKILSVLNVSADYILRGYVNDNSPVNKIFTELSPEDAARAESILLSFYEAVREKYNNNENI